MADQPPSKLDEGQADLMSRIIQHQKVMFQAMQGAEMPEWLGSDMTMPQFKILFLLYTHGRLRMSDISNTLGKNLSTATGLVDRLVEQNLIRREEASDDRRVVIVRLTGSGTHLCDSFLQAGWQHARRMLARLTPSELREVERGMSLMARAALEDAEERLAASNTRKPDFETIQNRLYQNSLEKESGRQADS